MGNNRAPGRDGITTSFVMFFWEIIKADVTKAVQELFFSNRMDERWKEMLIILIPMVESANSPAQFHPISLFQSFYKVVAKILVNRMKPMLGNIIWEEQGVFVPSRSISNHGFYLQLAALYQDGGTYGS